jgi:hypothetical protein
MSSNRTNSPPARPDPILAEHAAEIRKLGKQTVENVIEIGRRLAECKKLVGHGAWLPWLEREFGWSDRTALNFMRVAELSKSETVSNLNLPVKALYLLAAPSTPTEARDEIIERVQGGSTITVADTKRAIEDAKDRKQPARKPRESKSAEEKAAYGAGLLLGWFEAADEAIQREFIRSLPAEMLADRDDDDIGPASVGETERLRARNEQLENENARLGRENIALRSEIEELNARLLDIPGFLDRTKEAAS